MIDQEVDAINFKEQLPESSIPANFSTEKVAKLGQQLINEYSNRSDPTFLKENDATRKKKIT